MTSSERPASRDDQDTGEEGMAGTVPSDAWKIGAGMEPDDAAEGLAMLQEAGDEGELTS